MTLPNQLSVLRILLTPVIVYTLIVDKPSHDKLAYQVTAFVLFFIASLTDWYDGYIARKFGSVSDFGKFLDPLADKILVLSMFVAFIIIEEVALWMVIVIASRDIVITLLRVYAVQNKKPVVTSTFAKWKTASQMTAIYLILFYLILKSQAHPTDGSTGLFDYLQSIGFVDTIMYFVTFITAISGVHYLVENRHHVKGFALSFFRLFLPNL